MEDIVVHSGFDRALDLTFRVFAMPVLIEYSNPHEGERLLIPISDGAVVGLKGNQLDVDTLAGSLVFVCEDPVKAFERLEEIKQDLISGDGLTLLDGQEGWRLERNERADDTLWED